jgi:hypothetical protein
MVEVGLALTVAGFSGTYTGRTLGMDLLPSSGLLYPHATLHEAPAKLAH